MDQLISLFFGSLALCAGVFWLWMLVECATRESSVGNTKIVWILIILFASVFGALLYWFLRRPRRNAELFERHIQRLRSRTL
jgi:hypothetical protein